MQPNSVGDVFLRDRRTIKGVEPRIARTGQEQVAWSYIMRFELESARSEAFVRTPGDRQCCGRGLRDRFLRPGRPMGRGAHDHRRIRPVPS